MNKLKYIFILSCSIFFLVFISCEKGKESNSTEIKSAEELVKESNLSLWQKIYNSSTRSKEKEVDVKVHNGLAIINEACAYDEYGNRIACDVAVVCNTSVDAICMIIITGEVDPSGERDRILIANSTDHILPQAYLAKYDKEGSNGDTTRFVNAIPLSPEEDLF